MDHEQLGERLEQLFRDAASRGLIPKPVLQEWEAEDAYQQQHTAAWWLWLLWTDESSNAKAFWRNRLTAPRPPSPEQIKRRAATKPCEFRWAVGVTTARRKVSTLDRCLASLADAGWPSPHVFADGFCAVPMADNLTLRLPAVGAWPNWILSLSELVQRHVDATHYLLVQDDAVFCQNVREHFEGLDLDGLVSLYRSARHPKGPTYRHQDGDRFVGALALVIPQQDARRLVSSSLAVDHRLRPTRGTDLIDGAVGKWCCDNGTPLWIHGPSLVQHIGETSTLGHEEQPSATFPGETFDATQLAQNASRGSQRSRIGLVGFNTAQGLGYLNRDMAANLPVDRWLVTAHSRFPRLPDVARVECVHAPADPPEKQIHAFLDGLDVVVFAETTCPRLAEIAQARGVKTVCVPMWEWLPRPQNATWMAHVDLWLCPTLHAHSIVSALELDGEVDYHPWPIDTWRIPFRQRESADRFVFAHGNGGPMDRKGGLVIAEIARRSGVPLLVFSQTQTHRATSTVEIDWNSVPVDFQGAAQDPAEIYRIGDVFLAPSKWEGLGLQLLECQAAGMPLICTDAPPMNECNPWRTFRSTPSVEMLTRPTTSHNVDPEAAAELLRELVGQDISEASTAAREWVVANRCWTTQGEMIKTKILN